MYDEMMRVAEEAARAACEVLLEHTDSIEVNFKQQQTQNLVTAADLAAEARILEIIGRAFPDHDILGEEGLSQAELGAEHLWVVDPLDGTTNYAQGIPQYCTAVSYVTSGEVQVGVVFDPSRDELFHAIRGEGAFLNGQPIQVSSRISLSECVIATGFYYDRGELMQRTLDSIGSLFKKNIRGIRRLGSAALDQCWVACGRMDGFYEYQLSPWDYAAASLIVEEAKGRCANRSGLPLELSSGSLIVSNANVFDELVSIVRWPS